MGNAVAKLIEILVSGLFSELLARGKNTFWIKLKYRRFDRELSRWVRQFINGNDGTVLTTGDFERYLSHHGPIERVFDAIIGDNPCGTKEKLIEHLVTRFKGMQSKGKTTTYQDEMALKDLFRGIYERIDCFYRLKLSDTDKYTIAEIRKAKREIIDSHKKGNAVLEEKLAEIHEVLKEGKEINAEDARWIYEIASKQLTEGRAETIYVLLPLLNENTGDLQYAVPYLIQLMSNYEVSAMPFLGIQKRIKDEVIYADIVRKTIYYSLIADNIEILNQVEARNADLKSIAENLLSNNYGAFFNQTEEIKNGLKTINIEVQKNYPNEHWLVLRISAIILSRNQVKNASDVIINLIGNDQTIVEKIIYFDRRAVELQCTNYDDSVAAEKLYQELANIRIRINKLPDNLQIKYFSAMLRVAIQISAEKAKVAVEDVPQQLQNSKEIKLLCMQVKIMNGEADLEQVVQLCVQNDQYWLFNNYLIQFKEDPTRIKDIIECHRFILTKDVSVFLLYVQVISMSEGKEKGKEILVYCIYDCDVLPEEPFEWEGGRHIYKDTAIRMGLYRKKVGDTVVIDNTKFTVAELLSLDCFLFRVSMKKMIDAGEVKCIHMAVDDQEKLDVEAFKKELLENIGEQNDEQQWLTFYKDMSAVPVTLFFAKQFVRVNYLHLTLALLRDTDIVMREFTNKTIPDGNQFILSFTTIIALHELGFDVEDCSADLFISTSSLKEIDIEVEQIVSENSREHVASMRVHDGQLYFNESSEEAKQAIMQNAVAIKAFAHKFRTVDNNKDLEMEEDPQFDCKEFFGICDYDTIAAAAEHQYTLVAFEAVISAFSGFSGINAKTVGIAEFLAMVCDNPNHLVDYTQKMLELRFMLPFSSATIKKLCALYKALPEREQGVVYEKWENALSRPLHDEKYKSIIAEQARKVYLQIYGTVDSMCPIWRLFTKYALQYLDINFSTM